MKKLTGWYLHGILGLLGALCLAIPMMTGAINIANDAYLDAVFDGSLILGRPTDNAVTANIVANRPQQVCLAWGDADVAASDGGSSPYPMKSETVEATVLKPAILVMNGLTAGNTYHYRLFFKDSGASSFQCTQEYTFETPRNEGEAYTFVVQSDSHLLNKADKALYTQSMSAMAGFEPDFLFDLGDTFLNDQVTDPAAQSYETIRKTGFEQRSYFDVLTRNAFLFLTIGNHEGEYGYFLDGTKDNLAAMSSNVRNTYYPNPVPNEFYTGNTQSEAGAGQPANYYAFEWGDALYVSIDPYRYTTMNVYADKDAWDWTMGKTQYDWFRITLEDSTAKYKFVFAHHAIGNMRGGAEIANLYEWGGYDNNGQYLFDQKRPGWGKPIQQVMKDAGVTIFFQGHDHLFAREDVEGVVYQTLPKPAEKIADMQSNYVSYPDADVLMNSGFLKIDVSSEHVHVDYFRNYFVSTGSQQNNTGIVYSYTVDAGHNVNVLKSVSDDVSTYGNGTESASTTARDAAQNAGTGTNQTGGKVKNGTNQKTGKIRPISIEIDGMKMNPDAPPFLDANGRTQVPIRLVAEGLGCMVSWEEDGAKDTVTIRKGATTILLKIGDCNATVNGEKVSMDTTATLSAGRTFMPVRFISETLGAGVFWDSVGRVVRITTESGQMASLTAAAAAAGSPTQTTVASSGLGAGGVVLGNPTDTTILMKAIADADSDLYVEYGPASGSYPLKTAAKSYKSGDVIEFSLSGLSPDQSYHYQLMTRTTGSLSYRVMQSGIFHTQRAAGSSFVFTIQTDPHRDENSDIPLYETALDNVAKDQPDFHIDLGDTFMGEKLASTQLETQQRYLDDRSFFAKITDSIPLFLVNGNHEGENGWIPKTGNNIVTWATNLRLKYFPNPTPGAFFSGSAAGQGNYYTYQWGDAQFIMLDPFWFSEQKASGDTDGWDYTLGRTQYDWLKKTLEDSNTKFKFVFIHNLVGGSGKDARGGAEAARYFEWGGLNSDGSDGFDTMRPGWGRPIHELLVENDVSAVFHGHDHFYAKQDLDGIVYQLVPQPSHPGSGVQNGSEYSYEEGVFLPPAGHIRVTVSAGQATAEYVSSSLTASKNGIIADSWIVK